MTRRSLWIISAIVSLVATLGHTQKASAQAFGVELHGNLMPASGGMGGASIARPQDLQSALAGNPATLAQFYGTQFSTGGGWVEATYNVSHLGGALPNVGPYSAKSEAEGSALGNLGVTQDFRAYDLPVTVGMGLLSSAGAGVSFRDVPNSNGTSALIQGLQIATAAGVDVTDRLALGATVMLGTVTIDGPFVGLSSAAYAYALRGSIGATYDVGCNSTLGVYYHSSQSFNFDDVIRLELPAGGFALVQDINMDLPENIGLGFANDRMLDGRLLLAVDVLYKQWDDAAFWNAIYDNQWVFQFGSQYELNRKVRLRAGYVFAENIMKQDPSLSAGGVTPPGGPNALQYVQAQFAAINQHRLTGGVGLRDVLPGVDMDFFVGGMFGVEEQFGPLTTTGLKGYWAGAGLTWRFGRGACCRLPAPDGWPGCSGI